MQGELEDPEIVQMIKELLDTRIRPVRTTFFLCLVFLRGVSQSDSVLLVVL